MTFDTAFAFTFPEERGLSDNPSDHGGRTKDGVTQANYDDYRDGLDLPRQDVALITPDEEIDFYRRRYWNPIGCDSLPPPLDVVCFDSAVNCGVSRASKWLQRAVGVKADGHIGPITLAAVAGAGPVKTATTILQWREDMCRQDAQDNPDQRQFLDGWLNRINALRKVVAS